MGNSLEERIIHFTVEFVNAVARINEDLIDEEYSYSVRYGKKKILFEYITVDEATAEDLLECMEYEEDQELDVREFTGNEDCVAYMVCEGYLYEKMYGYSAYQEDIYGDGDQAEKLHDAVHRIAGKYDLWFEWAGGALVFYDNQIQDHAETAAKTS